MPTTVSGTILQTPEPGILQVLDDHLVKEKLSGLSTMMASLHRSRRGAGSWQTGALTLTKC